MTDQTPIPSPRGMLTAKAYADPAAPIEISRPTVQFTVGAPHAIIQFQRRSKRTGEWNAPESYHPTQDDWAKRAPAGSPEGYWSDAEVEADLLAYLAAEFGITNAVIVDATPAQPDEPVQQTHLEKAADTAPAPAKP